MLITVNLLDLVVLGIIAISVVLFLAFCVVNDIKMKREEKKKRKILNESK